MNNGAMTVLVVVQFLITMLFYPIRVGANGHVSLAHDKADVDLTLFRITVARFRLKREKGIFAVQINGKPVGKDKKMSLKTFVNVAKQYRLEGIKARGNLLALIATQDAKATALLCAGIMGALQPLVSNLQIFTAKPSDTLEIDGRIKIKINILQIVNMIFAGLRG